MAQEEKAAETGAVIMVLTNCNEMKDKENKVIGQTGWYLPEVAHPYDVFAGKGYKIAFASIKGGSCEMDFSSYKDTVLKDKPDEACVKFVELIRASDENEKEIGADKGVSDVKGQIGRDESGDANDRVINKICLDTVTTSSLQGSASNYDIIFFAGGHGTCWDFYDSNPKHDMASKKDTRDMHGLARSIYENKDKPGVVAAVCHGPLALVGLTLSDGTLLVKDKKVCGFTNDEEKAVKQDENVPLLLETGLINDGGIFEKGDNWAVKFVSDSGVVTGQNPASASATAGECLEELKRLREKK